jgi:hypothetical protein
MLQALLTAILFRLFGLEATEQKPLPDKEEKQ